MAARVMVRDECEAALAQGRDHTRLHRHCHALALRPCMAILVIETTFYAVRHALAVVPDSAPVYTIPVSMYTVVNDAGASSMKPC